MSGPVGPGLVQSMALHIMKIQNTPQWRRCFLMWLEWEFENLKNELRLHKSWFRSSWPKRRLPANPGSSSCGPAANKHEWQHEGYVIQAKLNTVVRALAGAFLMGHLPLRVLGQVSYDLFVCGETDLAVFFFNATVNEANKTTAGRDLMAEVQQAVKARGLPLHMRPPEEAC